MRLYEFLRALGIDRGTLSGSWLRDDCMLCSSPRAGQRGKIDFFPSFSRPVASSSEEEQKVELSHSAIVRSQVFPTYLRELWGLTKHYQDSKDDVSVAEIKTVIDRFCRLVQPDLMSCFRLPVRGIIKQYGYEISTEITPACSFYQLKNENRVRGSDVKRGWKFHIAIHDRSDTPEESVVYSLWQALVPYFVQYQIPVVKVRGYDGPKDQDLGENERGKQITLYLDQNNLDFYVAHFPDMIAAITQQFLDRSVTVGQLPMDSWPIVGTPFSYRYDTDQSGRRREGAPYKPDPVADPFLAMKIYFISDQVQRLEAVSEQNAALGKSPRSVVESDKDGSDGLSESDGADSDDITAGSYQPKPRSHRVPPLKLDSLK